MTRRSTARTSPPLSWWKRVSAWVAATVKNEKVATALIIPILFLSFTTWWNYSEAQEARIKALQIDRITLVQDSGKELDLALASYYHSISDLGLAERGLKMPGDAKVVPVEKAKIAVVEARKEARTALVEHASDIQRLRGAFDVNASSQYMTSLAAINETIEHGASINKTGQNITTLSKLVVSRNELVDAAMDKVS